MKATVEWIRADEEFPPEGICVAAAVTGRYPDGERFWLVHPAYFTRTHYVEETGEVVEDCFVDSDRVIRFPLGGASEEVVTHWAALPTLPGATVPGIFGDDVEAALQAASVRPQGRP